MTYRHAFAEALEARTLLTTLPAGFQQTLVTRVPTQVATSMEFAPDGRIFVADNRTGNVRIIKNGKLLSTVFADVQVDTYRERGFEALALDPDFANNGYVYVYYTHADPSNPNTAPNGAKNYLSRFKASKSNPDIADSTFGEQVLIKNIDSTTGIHNGGFMHFGKDGMLYLAIGESKVGSNATDLSKIEGKMLRLNVKNYPNMIPSDNPFVNKAGARGEIFAYGFRNPFTGAIDPITGRILENDVGQGTWEEINDVVKGANYGWPTGEGALKKTGLTDPLFAYNHNGGSAAITGGVFFNSDKFPSSYKGDYFFADEVNAWIHVLDLATKKSTDFATNGPKFLDLDVGPDGNLWGLDIGGSIYKFTYTGSLNHTPTAAASADKTDGALPMTVNFSGNGSSDPDNDTLTYSWKFGDGATGSGKTVSHTYTVAGTYNATLTVSDGKGGSDTTAAIKITAGNSAPSPVISLPASDLKYSAGETINFSGDATDAEDSNLPDSAFHWSIVFHHQTHTHPFIDAIDGVRSGSFVIPTSGEVSPDQWYRVHLTVTDSDGLSKDVYTDVLPNRSKFTLASNIVGIQLKLDGAPKSAPTTTLGVVGMERTISADTLVSLNGKSYEFVSWSDGGDAAHTILTPDGDSTFTATYKEIPTTSMTLSPKADAYVQDGTSAAKNFGTTTSLLVKKNATGYNRETYLSFDLSNVSSIGNAILKLYGGGSATGSVQVAAYKTSTSWTETGITFDNKPAASGGALATFTVTDTADHTREIDLTSFLQSEKKAGRNKVAIVLKATATSNPVASFASREAKSNKPSLVITTSGDDPNPEPGNTLDTIADSFVRSGTNADKNFGGGATIDVKKGSTEYQREGYLKFDISKLGAVSTAKLRLFGSLSDVTASNIVTEVYGADDSTWLETGLTFNNRPQANTGIIGSATVKDAVGAWYEFDISQYIKDQQSAGKAQVTLVLKNAANAAPTTTFHSREAVTNRPQLVVG